MNQPTAAGRPKIAAARAFLDHLQPDRGDQAAVVAFNADAALLQPLTTDRAALVTALARIQIAPQTCLVCGVHFADTELASPRHRPDHAATMIVLTDGRSNPRPASEAVERATAAKARGVVVFTIGLGDDLDADALRDMASRPEFAYRAPDAEDLAEGEVLDTFPIVRRQDEARWGRFRTKDLVLAYYNALAAGNLDAWVKG